MKKQSSFVSAISVVLVFVCVMPFVYIFVKSFFENGELTLMHYYDVFLKTPQYLDRFWRSMTLCVCIAAGQVLVSTLAGYAFAKVRFFGKKVIFFLMIILMVLPLQVTLVPNYILLNEIGLLNTYYALALPMIFVPLGTFIMTQGFKAVPNEVIEAARLDGCNSIGILFRIAIPMNKSALICTMILSFLDGWNMVEQPIVYLKDFVNYPLSVALATTSPVNLGVKIVCCILTIIPPLFFFTCFNRDMAEGIAIGGEK